MQTVTTFELCPGLARREHVLQTNTAVRLETVGDALVVFLRVGQTPITRVAVKKIVSTPYSADTATFAVEDPLTHGVVKEVADTAEILTQLCIALQVAAHLLRRLSGVAHRAHYFFDLVPVHLVRFIEVLLLVVFCLVVAEPAVKHLTTTRSHLTEKYESEN